MADHAYVEVVLLLEPIDDLLQRRITLELETIPKSPFDGTVLALLRRDGLGEAKEWQRQIDEAVLVWLELLLSIDDLPMHCLIHGL